jgi:hypothetical protein
MNADIHLEHRAGSSQGKHEGEPSLGLCDRLDRTRDNSQRQLSAIHRSDKAFTALVSVAGLAQFLTLRILEAARQAWIEPGIDVCCETVELNQRQIEVLCQSFFRCIAACSSLLPLLKRPRRLCHRWCHDLPDDPTQRPRKPRTTALSGSLIVNRAQKPPRTTSAPAQISMSTTCGSCTSKYISFSTEAFTNSLPLPSRTRP